MSIINTIILIMYTYMYYMYNYTHKHALMYYKCNNLFNRISDLKRHLKASIEENTLLLERLLKARDETGQLLQYMVQDQTTYIQILRNQLPADHLNEG